MLIKQLILPSKDEEELALLNGAAIIGMPKNCQNFLPFRVFPQKFLKTIEFGKTTVFSGNLSGIRTMLVSVLNAMLSEDYTALQGMSDDTLHEFCKLCELRYSKNIKKNDFDFVYVTQESIHKYARKKYALYEDKKKWSVLNCFDQFFEVDCFVIVDTPEAYMSFYEQCEFCGYIETAIHQNNCQFVLLTNSPVLFGIKDAVLYDFDNAPLLPYSWHRSPLVSEYKIHFNTTIQMHTYNKKK